MKKTLLSLAMSFAVGFSVAAGANAASDKKEPSTDLPSWGVMASYSIPFGAGLSGTYSVYPSTLNARLSVYPGVADVGSLADVGNVDSNGFTVEPKIKFGNVGAYADWFPFGGSFRLTAGLASLGQSKIDAKGSITNTNSVSITTGNGTTNINIGGTNYSVADNTTYTYNGVTYTLSGGTLSGGGQTVSAADLKTVVATMNVEANIRWKGVSPYVGLGFGNSVPQDGWGFFFDLGVFLTGSPTLDTTASANCGAVSDSLKAACNTMVTEMNKQKDTAVQEVKDGLGSIKVLPNLALGLAFSW